MSGEGRGTKGVSLLPRTDLFQAPYYRGGKRGAVEDKVKGKVQLARKKKYGKGRALILRLLGPALAKRSRAQ